MDIISSIASINAIIIAILISNKKKKRINDYILIFWIINFALHFAIPFCIERQFLFHESIWGLVLGIIMVTHGPFLYVYTKSLTSTNFKFNFRNFYHFGFILLYAATFLPMLSLSPQMIMDIVEQKSDLSLYVLLPMLTLLFIQIYFLVRTIILIIEHQASIKQSFSFVEKINLNWIKLIVYGYMGLIILSFILYGLASAQIISVFWMDYILIMCNMVLFFYIVYYGYKQNAIQLVIPIAAKNKSKHTFKILPETKTKKPEADNISKIHSPIISELLHIMDEEQLYLEPELNIGNIANKLHIHSHQLSKIINTQLNKNFFEFVNDYRVKEFKRLVSDPKNKNISILGLAYDAGFNSKATFYRFFKNSTGLTPSEFREEYQF